MSNRPVTPLGRKLVAAILGTTFLALVLAFLLNLLPTFLGFRQNISDKSLALADLMSTSLVASVDFHDAPAAEETLASLSLLHNVTGAAVYLDGDTLFASYGHAPFPMVVDKPSLDSRLSDLTVATPIPASAPRSSLVINISMNEQWDILKRQLTAGLGVFIIVALLSFKMAGSFRRKLGDPLQELTNVVADISQSRDYSRRVNYESNDEIGVLVTEFNSMLRKIAYRDIQLSRHSEILEQKVQERTEQLQENQQELLNNNQLLLKEIQKRAKAEMIREEVERINRHDLKSGLSLVIGYPELLLKDGDLTHEQEKRIKRIRAAGYRMLDMIRNHLDMFKMEKGIYNLSRKSVDIVEIICGLEEEFAPLLASTGVHLSVELNGNEVVGDEVFPISGEEPLVRALLRNLIQNGVEASGYGDTVTVRLEDVGKKVLSVANTAPVPHEVRHRIFDKYVTHGKENGTGLGTYIAALIARTHGANITMKTDDKSGTVMTVAFRQSNRQAKPTSMI